MPYPKAKVINVSGDTKKRLAALRGPHFGSSDHDILKRLLALGEATAKTLGLDTATEIPPACQQSGQS